MSLYSPTAARSTPYGIFQAITPQYAVNSATNGAVAQNERIVSIMEEIALVIALKRHCSIDGETAADFIKQIRDLAVNDREWFKARLEETFDYKIK